MSKVKYRYNPKTLTYERAVVGWKDRLFIVLTYLGAGIVFSTIFLSIFFSFFDSPKEKELKRENEQLALQYKILNQRMNNLNQVLENISERDNAVYRTIFEAEPIPENIRKAGFGGANRYEDLEGFESSALMINTTKKLDKIAKQMYIQSKSLDDIYQLALEKEKMLSAIPAIMPVAGKDLKRVASGYGMRFHPILKIRRMHTGMDFTASTGTEIYSTGDGVVSEVKYSYSGYGRHVIIDHGYGYQTLYAHLSKAEVRVGQKIKRGELIGLVGSTGLSEAPHLHYEVIKDGNKVNPAYYYSNDLSPEEYELMIEISSQANQSFD